MKSLISQGITGSQEKAASRLMYVLLKCPSSWSLHPATLQPAIGPEPPPKLLAGEGLCRVFLPEDPHLPRHTSLPPLSAPKIWVTLAPSTLLLRLFP